jgi:hypothetical protein
MLKKLKSLIRDDTVYIALLLVLVGVGSFGLGRMTLQSVPGQTASVGLSVMATATNSLGGVNPSTTTRNLLSAATTTTSITQPTAPFVASKSGTKYHKITCPGAKQIKDTNKIFFETESDAEASGYTRAANCKF